VLHACLRCCQVEQVVAQLRSGQLALPPVDWLHLSPPCQNVSLRKKREHRVFSGAELL
jgi:site-specific DNA-cytosine methylase